MTTPPTKAEQAATHSARSGQATHSAQNEHPLTPAGVTLAEALTRWYAELSVEGKSQRTLAAYRYATDRLPGTQVLSSITKADLVTLMAAAEAQGLSPATRHAIYRALRTFFRWAVAEGLIATSPVTLKPPKVPETTVEFVTDVEWAAILATTRTRSRWAFRARRDRAILLMLATTGARLSEVAGLKLSDVDMDAGTILVHGKGQKDRVLPLLPDAREALEAYLRLERPRSPFSSVTDALWLSTRGVMTSNGIGQLVAERGHAAGIKRRVHPHELRHRAIAGWLKAGMPQPLVMALSGHSTPAMLGRYGKYTRQDDAIAYLRGLSA